MVICFFFREFKIEDGKAVIPLGITVQGDVLIVIYHARSTLGGRLQAKVIINLRPYMEDLLFLVAVLYHNCICDLIKYMALFAILCSKKCVSFSCAWEFSLFKPSKYIQS